MVIYEDNVTYIAQIKMGYVKEDQIKHISPYELLGSDVDVK